VLKARSAVPNQSAVFSSYTIYASPLFTLRPDGLFVKHYFAGAQRAASRLSGTVYQPPGVTGLSPSATGTTGVTGVTGLSPSCPDLQARQIADLERHIGRKVSHRAHRPLPDTLRRTGGSLFFFHPDHLGSGTLITDANGDAYQFFVNLPFGETLAEQRATGAYSNVYKFTGKELDAETGLYYHGARYYDPERSIWLSVDPLADHPNQVDKSPYAYAWNNPVRLTDPTGMAPEGGEGDIYNLNGVHIGNDGIDDKQVYLKYTYDDTQMSQMDALMETSSSNGWGMMPNYLTTNATKETGLTNDKLNMNSTLATIREVEGYGTPLGYNSQYGNNTFSDYSDHPREEKTRWGHTSSAAGAYQFLASTWDRHAKSLGLTDFGPASQDKAAVAEIGLVKGATDLINQGKYEPALNKLSVKWTSLPGGSQQWKSNVNSIFLKHRANELTGKSILGK
jgi:RHS repeat-associated protein